MTLGKPEVTRRAYDHGPYSHASIRLAMPRTRRSSILARASLLTLMLSATGVVAQIANAGTYMQAGAAQGRVIADLVSGDDPAVAEKGSSAPESDRPDFQRLKLEGAKNSSYLGQSFALAADTAPERGLASFQEDIAPILKRNCVRCHGPDEQKAGVRIDTLNPDLLLGDDVDWWLEVLTVLSNGAMPPEGEGELTGDDRGRVMEWLATEIQAASAARRAGKQHSSFRRMTRYEYDYALQDLLGLPIRFADGLPPDPTSEDGFQNSSDALHLTSMQLRAYLESGRKALREATVLGEQPASLFWTIPMKSAAAIEWTKQDGQLEGIKKKHKDDPEKLKEELARRTNGFAARPKDTHYEDLSTGRKARQTWAYGGAKFAWKPTSSRSNLPEEPDHIAVLPPRKTGRDGRQRVQGDGLLVELGDLIPEVGTLRVRVLAARASVENEYLPSLQLMFGWQASNDSSAVVRVSQADLVIDAPRGAPKTYQWDIPISQIYPRNSVRKISKLGGLPSPSEFLKLVNTSVSDTSIQIYSVEVVGAFYEQWPPASHTRIFFDSPNKLDEPVYAREILGRFMSRAWRREASTVEVDQKLELFKRLRPQFAGLEEALIEVLATVLSSPHFLYLVVQADTADQQADEEAPARLTDIELATRLSIFLWCSTPDDELSALANAGQLQRPEVLSRQVERMLGDEKSRRFSRHFVRQWLNLPLLGFLHVDRKLYPQFDASLMEAMQEEPVAFFHELLGRDHSALEFIHSDFTMANERLAIHYGLDDVAGNHFRRVELGEQLMRGGLLTQPGLLAMNSDGKDSHPLKRGIWMLERILNDPPPPPPPAVPEIDLSDPEIAKLTLKERIENHRDDPACMSCHAKIDPWGIAFENFDAVGSWRTEVQGRPVDAISTLFNNQKLEGMDGLKRFLLENRQDQFMRALTHKLTTYALGRPLTFGDRSNIDQLTAEARKQGDGLATMVTLIATSELFQSK